MTQSLSNNKNRSHESLERAEQEKSNTSAAEDTVGIKILETQDDHTVHAAVTTESDSLRIAIFGELHVQHENNLKKELCSNTTNNSNHKQGEEKSLQNPFSRTVHQVYFMPNIKGPDPEEYGAEPLVYDPKTRNSFIRKVMILLLVAMLFTTAVLVFVNTNEVGSMVVFYGMVCYTCGRMPPCNYILFVIGVLLYTGFAAMVTIKYNIVILTIATVATVAIVLLCLGLAYTSFDFTKYFLVVTVILMALGISSLIVFILRIYYDLKLLQVILSIVISVVQAVALVITMQMVLGGKSIRYGVDDYVLAAYVLYTSIIGMFLRLLDILNFFMGDD